ncbi:hypothetical protein Tco_0785265, partial [Tanacetum coccineum]
MRELQEDTFSRNKNNDAHEHVERILDIVSLFNIPGVTHDTVMLRVFPITLTRVARSNNTEGIAAIVSKLDSLGRDMKKLKENVHAIQRLSMASLEDLPLSAMELNIAWALLDTTHALTIAHCLEKKAKLEGANEQAPGKLVGTPSRRMIQCKAVYTNDEAPIDNISIKSTDEVSDIANIEITCGSGRNDVPTKVFPMQYRQKSQTPIVHSF